MTLARFKFNSIYLIQPLFNACFYGIKGIFTLYIIAHLSLTESQAISIFATFMTLCYATTLAGGYIGDRWIGVRNASLIGGILTVIGLICALFPHEDLCFLGLAIASLGSGFFKPNLLAAIGLIFEDAKDLKKDKAYSATFMTWNIGGFALPALCGVVGETFGLSYGVLMVIALFAAGTYLIYRTMQLHPSQEAKQVFTVPKIQLWGVVLSLITLLYFLFKYQEFVHGMMGIITCGSLIYLGKLIYQSTHQERKGIGMVIAYAVLFALYCSLFEQAGSSMLLFVKKTIDRNIMGVEISATTLLSFGAFFILIWGPIQLFFSNRYLEKTKPLDGFTKSGIGFLFAALSFGILVWGTHQGPPIPLSWLLGAMFVQIMGELWVVPIGLSKISQHSPARLESVMMGFWTMAIAYGHYFAGIIAQFSVAATPENSIAQYRTFFVYLGWTALAIGVAVLLCRSVKSYILNAKIE